MPSVDLDAPEHAICSQALASNTREIALLRETNARLHRRRQDAEAQRDEWRQLAGALRVQAARISGILMDLEPGSFVAAAEALDEIGEIINGPRPTAAKPTEPR